MRIGLLADTHDRVPVVAELVRIFTDAGVGLVIHAGDYCSPFSLEPFAAATVPLMGVFGRNDGDPEGLRETAATHVGTELYESPHSFEINGVRIMVVHDLGDVMGRSIKAHAIILHGATHQYDISTRGDTLMINPGEACGWLHGTCTAAILDLETRQVERVEL